MHKFVTKNHNVALILLMHWGLYNKWLTFFRWYFNCIILHNDYGILIEISDVCLQESNGHYAKIGSGIGLALSMCKPLHQSIT